MRRVPIILAAALLVAAIAAGGAYMLGLMPGTEPNAIRLAKAAVLGLLRDPGSAEFADISVTADRRTVCGEVNAKNAYGAMAGRTMFVSTGGRAVLHPGVVDMDRWNRNVLSAMRLSSWELYEDVSREHEGECAFLRKAVACPEISEDQATALLELCARREHSLSSARDTIIRFPRYP